MLPHTDVLSPAEQAHAHACGWKLVDIYDTQHRRPFLCAVPTTHVPSIKLAMSQISLMMSQRNDAVWSKALRALTEDRVS